MIIFGSSFLLPFLLGLYTYKKYPTIPQRKLLAIISILVGISVSIINLAIYFMFLWEYWGYEFLLLLIVFSVDFLITPIFLFGTIKLLQRKNEKKPWKHVALVVPLSISLIISALIISVPFMPLVKIYPSYSYRVTIDTNGSNSYFIYLPLPLEDNVLDTPLINSIEKISGNVNVSVASTIHGPALNISAIGSFQIATSTRIGDEYAFHNASLRMSLYSPYFWIYYNTSSSDEIELDM